MRVQIRPYLQRVTVYANGKQTEYSEQEALELAQELNAHFARQNREHAKASLTASEPPCDSII